MHRLIHQSEHAREGGVGQEDSRNTVPRVAQTGKTQPMPPEFRLAACTVFGTYLIHPREQILRCPPSNFRLEWRRYPLLRLQGCLEGIPEQQLEHLSAMLHLLGPRVPN